MPLNRDQPQIQIPTIELSGVNLSVAMNPADPTQRILVVGPIFMTMPLDAEARRAIIRGLTGVEIAGRMDIPGT